MNMKELGKRLVCGETGIAMGAIVGSMIGGVLGGTVGACVGFGIWAIGEAVGQTTIYQLS